MPSFFLCVYAITAAKILLACSIILDEKKSSGGVNFFERSVDLFQNGFIFLEAGEGNADPGGSVRISLNAGGIGYGRSHWSSSGSWDRRGTNSFRRNRFTFVVHQVIRMTYPGSLPDIDIMDKLR